MRGNNYTVAAARARDSFLEADSSALVRKFSLDADEEYLYLSFLDLDLRLARKSGMIEKRYGRTSGAKDAEAVWHDASDFSTTLSVFDYLIYSSDQRRLSGSWRPISHFGLGFHQSKPGEGGFFFREIAWCETNRDKLQEAFVNLGATQMPVGDIAYAVTLFPDLPLYFQFWEGDDEFPSKLSFLFDENVISYVHYETLYYLLEMFFSRLWEIVGE